MHSNHLKYMLLGGIGVFAVAVGVGIPLQSALLVAFVLACPLMMMLMMSGGGQHSQSSRPEPGRSHDH